MHKKEMIEAICKVTNLQKMKSELILTRFFDTIIQSLKEGESVQLTGFGTFSVSERKARSCRNPRTGEAIQIKAAKTPVFIPGKTLKDAVKIKK
jgi:nucleoid DNA-binding protein